MGSAFYRSGVKKNKNSETCISWLNDCIVVRTSTFGDCLFLPDHAHLQGYLSLLTCDLYELRLSILSRILLSETGNLPQDSQKAAITRDIKKTLYNFNDDFTTPPRCRQLQNQEAPPTGIPFQETAEKSIVKGQTAQQWTDAQGHVLLRQLSETLSTTKPAVSGHWYQILKVRDGAEDTLLHQSGLSDCKQQVIRTSDSTPSPQHVESSLVKNTCGFYLKAHKGVDVSQKCSVPGTSIGARLPFFDSDQRLNCTQQLCVPSACGKTTPSSRVLLQRAFTSGNRQLLEPAAALSLSLSQSALAVPSLKNCCTFSPITRVAPYLEAEGSLRASPSTLHFVQKPQGLENSSVKSQLTRLPSSSDSLVDTPFSPCKDAKHIRVGSYNARSSSFSRSPESSTLSGSRSLLSSFNPKEELSTTLSSSSHPLHQLACDSDFFLEKATHYSYPSSSSSQLFSGCNGNSPFFPDEMFMTPLSSPVSRTPTSRLLEEQLSGTLGSKRSESFAPPTPSSHRRFVQVRNPVYDIMGSADNVAPSTPKSPRLSNANQPPHPKRLKLSQEVEHVAKSGMLPCHTSSHSGLVTHSHLLRPRPSTEAMSPYSSGLLSQTPRPALRNRWKRNTVGGVPASPMYDTTPSSSSREAHRSGSNPDFRTFALKKRLTKKTPKKGFQEKNFMDELYDVVEFSDNENEKSNVLRRRERGVSGKNYGTKTDNNHTDDIVMPSNGPADGGDKTDEDRFNQEFERDPRSITPKTPDRRRSLPFQSVGKILNHVPVSSVPGGQPRRSSIGDPQEATASPSRRSSALGSVLPTLQRYFNRPFRQRAFADLSKKHAALVAKQKRTSVDTVSLPLPSRPTRRRTTPSVTRSTRTERDVATLKQQQASFHCLRKTDTSRTQDASAVPSRENGSNAVSSNIATMEASLELPKTPRIVVPREGTRRRRLRRASCPEPSTNLQRRKESSSVADKVIAPLRQRKTKVRSDVSSRSKASNPSFASRCPPSSLHLSLPGSSLSPSDPHTQSFEPPLTQRGKSHTTAPQSIAVGDAPLLQDSQSYCGTHVDASCTYSFPRNQHLSKASVVSVAKRPRKSLTDSRRSELFYEPRKRCKTEGDSLRVPDDPPSLHMHLHPQPSHQWRHTRSGLRY